MESLTKDKTNMLSVALLTQLAKLADKNNLAAEHINNPLIRYTQDERALIVSALNKDKLTDIFSMGYICGFIGRFVQLEEIKTEGKPSSILPKNLVLQIMSDIFGKMRGVSIARKTVEISSSSNPVFMDAYFVGATDLDNFTKFISLSDASYYPLKWYEYLQ